MQEVLKFIEDLDIKNNEYVIAAISGGPDSMALLDILVKLKLNVVCAHVNHKVRIESENEAKKVKEFCIKNNIIFEYMEINDYDKSNFENQARTKRYNFFEELIKKYNSKYLFTAHHGDDLVETVLMKIVRGTSLKGYSGMTRILDKNSHKIVRPFLTVTKTDLLKYVEENNIWYAIDKTNLLDVHTRNRYRKYILPFLKKEDPNVHLKFKKFSDEIKECSDFIEKYSLNEYYRIVKSNILNINEFLKLDEIIQKQIIHIMLEKIYENNIDLINSKHICNIINLINGNNGSISLPNNYKAIKEYNEFLITKLINNEDYEYIIKDVVKLPNGKKIEILESSEETDNNIIYLNSNDIKLPIKVRNKKSGDTIQIKNMVGTKKIKDIFINSKIPKRDRMIWPIVVDSNDNILWIPGLKKSKFDSKKSGNYDIILKYS